MSGSPRPTRTAAVALLAAALTALPATARPWSDEAHRLVNERATTTLPEPLRDLFEGNQAVLRAHSIDPDLWKLHRADEGPNHFMNLDAFDDLEAGSVPVSETAHRKRHGPDVARQGRLPWRVGEAHDELVAAFRARDWTRALETAATLGHYVADAFVPLHATVDFDGQQSGQDGLHERWEVDLFSRFQRQIEPAVTPGDARVISDPVMFAFGALQESLEQAGAVLEADRRSAGRRDLLETPADDRYDDGYYSRLYELEGERLVARLTAAAEATGSLWLSAWQRAGRPEPEPDLHVAYVRGESRLVVALLEGAGAALVDDAVERGALPHLGALRREGSVGRVIPPFPARPASSQATLWTGAWPERHGVVGDGATRPSGSVLETIPGERSTALGAEPLWVTSAREGVPTVVVGVPQARPFSPFLDAKRFGADLGKHLTLVAADDSGIDEAALTADDLRPGAPTSWSGGESGPSAREVMVPVGSGSLPGLLFDDPEDPATGLDTLALSATRDLSRSVLVKPVPAGDAEDAFVGVPFGTADGPVLVYFRLFALSTDGREILLWHSAGARARSSRERVGVAIQAHGGLLEEGSHRLYRAGALGAPLWEGGDGRAERRYLDTLRLVVRQQSRAASLVLDQTRWGLALVTVPIPAEPLALWGGRLDPTAPGYDPAGALRLRAFLDQALGLADEWVGGVARLTPEDAALAVLGDRGPRGVHTVARPNVALEAAGLLATDDEGTVDLARTKVVYAPANGGFLVVNGEARPGGIQPRRGESLVRGASIGVARELRDPSTGEPVIAELIMPGDRGAPPGLGGPPGGFLYLRPAPGVLLSPSTRGPAVAPIEPAADAFDPSDPAAPGLLVLTGRGVAGGRSLGDVAAVDLAPTLARLLGLPAPMQAQGRFIERALSSESR